MRSIASEIRTRVRLTQAVDFLSSFYNHDLPSKDIKGLLLFPNNSQYCYACCILKGIIQVLPDDLISQLPVVSDIFDKFTNVPSDLMIDDSFWKQVFSIPNLLDVHCGTNYVHGKQYIPVDFLESYLAICPQPIRDYFQINPNHDDCKMAVDIEFECAPSDLSISIMNCLLENYKDYPAIIVNIGRFHDFSLNIPSYLCLGNFGNYEVKQVTCYHSSHYCSFIKTDFYYVFDNHLSYDHCIIPPIVNITETINNTIQYSGAILFLKKIDGTSVFPQDSFMHPFDSSFNTYYNQFSQSLQTFVTSSSSSQSNSINKSHENDIESCCQLNSNHILSDNEEEFANDEVKDTNVYMPLEEEDIEEELLTASQLQTIYSYEDAIHEIKTINAATTLPKDFILSQHPEDLVMVDLQDLQGVDKSLRGCLAIDPTNCLKDCTLNSSNRPERIIIFTVFMQNLLTLVRQWNAKQCEIDPTHVEQIRQRIGIKEDHDELDNINYISTVLHSFLHDCEDKKTTPTVKMIKRVLEHDCFLSFEENNEELKPDFFTPENYNWSLRYDDLKDVVNAIFITRKTVKEVRERSSKRKECNTVINSNPEVIETREMSPSKPKNKRKLSQEEYNGIHKRFINAYVLLANDKSDIDFIQAYIESEHLSLITQERLQYWLKRWKLEHKNDFSDPGNIQKATWVPTPQGGLRKSCQQFDIWADYALITMLLDNPGWTLKQYMDCLNAQLHRKLIHAKKEFTLSCVTTEIARFSFEAQAYSYCPPERNTLGARIARAVWSKEMQIIKDCERTLLIFIDETALITNISRNSGFSFNGVAPTCSRVYRGTKTNALSALIPGFGSITCFIGGSGINSDTYSKFIRNVNQVVRLYIDSSPDCVPIVIQDNARIHLTKNVKQAFRDTGMLAMVQPPYSPHLNYVAESFFGFEKQHITCDPSLFLHKGNRKMRDIINAWNKIAYKWSPIVSTRFYCKWCEILKACEQGVILTKTVKMRKSELMNESTEVIDEDHIKLIMKNLRYRRVYRKIEKKDE